MNREVRICENCGTKNSIEKLECESCGYDLSFVVPTIESDEKETATARWKITSTGGSVSAIVSGGETIGREGDILSDYVNDSDYISRKHARFEVADGKLFVTDFSTNGTTINGERIEKNKLTEVNTGDEIAFADMAFIIQNAD